MASDKTCWRKIGLIYFSLQTSTCKLNAARISSRKYSFLSVNQFLKTVPRLKKNSDICTEN